MASCLQYLNERGTKLDQSTIIEQANRRFEADWDILERRLVLAPGKDVLARLNDILQQKHKITITETMTIDQMSKTETNPDFLTTLDDLDFFYVE